MNSPNLTRRHLIAALGAGSAFAAMPAWAQGHSVHRSGSHGRGGQRIPAGFGELSGDVIDLTVGSGHRIVEGRRGPG
ncbi:MAG: hypothetical protein ACK554_09195, partial [Erythrobacteraceae bacterium]